MDFIASILAFFALLFSPYSAPIPQDIPALITPHAEIIFGGDMLFDRTIRTTIEQKGGDYIFSCIDDTLAPADLVVANLEGPITDNPSVSQNSEPGDGNNYTFTQPPLTAALLARHNVRLVNIGNNHMLDFSREGLLSTKAYLEAAGVQYFGDPDSLEADKVARIEIRGVPLSFVNWSDWNSDKTDHTVAQVRKEVEAGRVTVVYTHWGIEYATTSPERVQVLARQFVDAGASIVIGSHPHVVQQHEIYSSTKLTTGKGINIYYSLGNFIFDQYWEEAVSHGLLLDVTFTPQGVASVKEIPVVLQHDRRTCPLNEG